MEFNQIEGIDINISSIKEIFNEIDVDNNGFIDYTEFIASCIDSSLEWGEKYLKETF
jgi:Ca2+-binding EF-hand superfamily protein